MKKAFVRVYLELSSRIKVQWLRRICLHSSCIDVINWSINICLNGKHNWWGLELDRKHSFRAAATDLLYFRTGKWICCGCDQWLPHLWHLNLGCWVDFHKKLPASRFAPATTAGSVALCLCAVVPLCLATALALESQNGKANINDNACHIFRSSTKIPIK